MGEIDQAAVAPQPRRRYRYYDLVMAAFVTVLVCANVIGAAKVAQVGPFTFGAGVLFFPISYVFGDVLTEVYGYARARKVVWAGFGALAFASLMSMLTNYAIKVGWEAVITPVTYRVVNFLKRVEHEDYFDRDTNFTPFSLET
jgi:uncharacterized PurR-regulated membrane protein YhhQ (DUF165 family)